MNTNTSINDNINVNTKTNDNLLNKINTPRVIFILASIIIFLVIMMFLILFDVNLSFFKSSKSKQEIVGEIFIILTFSLLVFGLCVVFLPSIKEFKQLFGQISNVTYVILYTIFAILFYTMVSSSTLNDYSYVINSIMLILGVFAFYKSATSNYIENFNINYERIKMIILFFCLITILITFYNINPGGAADKYFGYTLLITIIISVFSFLYVIILLTLPGDEGKQKQNLLNNFSSFGVYGSVGFLIFLIIVTAIISFNKNSFFKNKEKCAAVLILLLVISITSIVLLSGNLFAGNLFAGKTTSSNMKILNSSLLILFGLVISSLIIYWITYNIENLSGNSSIISFVLNLLLVAIILALIYKTIHVKLPGGNSKKNAFFNMILTTIFYIPCLLSGAFDYMAKMAMGQYNSTNASFFIMLIAATCLIVAYFKIPSLFNLISMQGGKQLVNKPVYTDDKYNLGSYEDLNGSDNFDYQYAISCWVFIDAAPPNMNPNYKKFTSLLNFGNKPNILYNPSKHTLMITMEQKDLKEITKNKFTDFDSDGNRIIYIDTNLLLQKWNNIIINYNGGTMDIFLNGELVKSSNEVVPYYTFDNLTIGEKDGIKGGICNVVYFRHALTSTNIYYIYNSVKNRTPPVINNSNKTIMIENINTAIDSVNIVT